MGIPLLLLIVRVALPVLVLLVQGQEFLGASLLLFYGLDHLDLGHLLELHLLRDVSRLFFDLVPLVGMDQVLDVSMCLDCELVTPQVDLGQVVTVFNIAGPLDLEPPSQPVTEILRQTVLCQANFTDLIFFLEHFE